MCAVTFAEVINSSDVPGGVVNILTGKPSELASAFATHMDVNAVIIAEKENARNKEVKEAGAANMKRILLWNEKNWNTVQGQSPYLIMDSQEIKTTWHPIETVGGGGAKY